MTASARKQRAYASARTPVGLATKNVADDTAHQKIYQEILDIIRVRVRWCGVAQEDREDCSMEFLARVLHSPERFLLTHKSGGEGYSAAWLATCAENWARDYIRKRNVRSLRETDWPSAVVSAEEQQWNWDCPDCSSATPEQSLLEGEFWRAVLIAIGRLQPVPRACFIDFHLKGRCIEHIAATMERTPNAIKLILARARRQVGSSLLRLGWTEEELRARASGSGTPQISQKIDQHLHLSENVK